MRISLLAVLLIAASPEPSSSALKLYPTSRCKTLYLIRHAEGLHNQAKANATRDRTHSPPYAVLFENVTGRTYWDAALTPQGRSQCEEARLKMLVSEAAFAEPEVVVVSPLTRTLQTASLIYEPGSRPFVASELCREKVDVYICEGRRNVSELRKEFTHVDFSSVETDEVSIHCFAVLTRALRMFWCRTPGFIIGRRTTQPPRPEHRSSWSGSWEGLSAYWP